MKFVNEPSVVVAGLIVAASAPVAVAQETRTWIDSPAIDRLYHVASNWSPAGIPGTLDTIVFTNPNFNVVRFVNWNDFLNSTLTLRVEVRGNGPIRFQQLGVLPVTHTTNSLFIENGNLQLEPGVTLRVTGSGLVDIRDRGGLVVRDGALYDAPSAPLRVGFETVPDLSTSTFSVLGTANTLDAMLGVEAGTESFAVVSGANAGWNMTQDLTIGAAGRGDLLIQNGAQVTNRDGVLGRDAGSDGVGNVNGPGSIWTNTRNLTIGRAGGGSVATLNIGIDGRLNVGDTAAARFPGYSYVEDSSPNASDGGLLLVQGGATLNNSNSGLSIGETAGTSGRVVVSGIGSTLNDNDTYVGYTGVGALEVNAGATVNADELFIGTFGGTGTVSVTGFASTLNVARDVTMGSAASVASTLTIGAGARLNVGNAASSSGGIAVSQTGPIGSPGGSIFVRAGSTLNNEAGGTILGFLNGTFGRLAVSGANAVVNDTSTIAGFSGTGVLQILNGGQLNTGFAGAGVFGGTGTITVDGTNSRLWANTDLLASGASTITTTNGGTLLIGDTANAGFTTDTLVVSDSNPASANAGGKVSIIGGSTLNHHANVLLAPDPNTHASVLVSGSNSTFSVGGWFLVGAYGNAVADVHIENGGMLDVTGTYTNFGNSSGNYTTTVTGNGSRLDAGSIVVSTSGVGSSHLFTVSAGAQTQTATQFVIGEGTSTSGVVTVTGAGSTINTGTMLEVGRSGSGTLNIESGGKVTANDVLLSTNPLGAGTVNISGADSVMEIAGTLTVGGAGAATLNLSSGLLRAGSIVCNSFSAFNFTGGDLATGSYTGNLTQNGGRLIVGPAAAGAPNTVGTTQINGSYQNTGGVIAIEFVSMSSTDFLIITGAATLNGSRLEINIAEGFAPDPTTLFFGLGSMTSLAVTSLAGVDAWGMIPTVAGNTAFRPITNPVELLLTDFARRGDVNRDGLVNNLDIAPFVGLLTGGSGSINFGLGFAGDINGDGSVNNLDIVPFVALLTGGRPIDHNDPDFQPLLALIPEPGSLSLLALAGLLMGRRRRVNR